MSFTLEVQDLDELQPAQLLELGDSILHNVSVQRARAMNLPQSGVVVAKSGYEFARGGVPRGALITRLNSTSIASVEDILDQVDQSGDNRDWRLRYVMPGSEYTSSIGVVEVNS